MVFRTEHHFYVDEATKRSTWLHPYDDPEFLRTLPDTHPANPNSQQGQAVRKRTEDERLMMEKMRERDKSTSKGGMTGSTGAATGGGGGGGGGGGDGDRNWFQKKKDELIGTKEERQMAKEEKRKAKEEQRKKMRVSGELGCFVAWLLMVLVEDARGIYGAEKGACTAAAR